MAHVLLVDDDEDDRDLFCLAVHELDAAIHCILARNGEEALQGLRMEKFPKPNLIFLDLNMPRVNGAEVLQQIKKDPLLQHIPIAIYTTSNVEDQLNEIKELGARYVLSKPSSFRHLSKMIGDIFEKEMIYAK